MKTVTLKELLATGATENLTVVLEADAKAEVQRAIANCGKLSKREQFAMAILQGLCSHKDCNLVSIVDAPIVINKAVRMADLLLERLEK